MESLRDQVSQLKSENEEMEFKLDHKNKEVKGLEVKLRSKTKELASSTLEKQSEVEGMKDEHKHQAS